MGRVNRAQDDSLAHVSVVLHRPRSPENIGAVARAMWNMGFSDLSVVAPFRWDEEAMVRMATRGAAHIVRSLAVHEKLEDALASARFVVGTTARGGGLRKPLWTPWRAAAHMAGLGKENKVALLFGPEDRGLTNHELRLCHLLVKIPTSRFASLNLAQAVLLLCYEVRRAVAPWREMEAIAQLATVGELERMYAQLQEILVKISMLPADPGDREMIKVRQFLSRLGLTRNEVQMIRGACRQVKWYGEMRAGQAAARGDDGGEHSRPDSGEA